MENIESFSEKTKKETSRISEAKALVEGVIQETEKDLAELEEIILEIKTISPDDTTELENNLKLKGQLNNIIDESKKMLALFEKLDDDFKKLNEKFLDATTKRRDQEN